MEANVLNTFSFAPALGKDEDIRLDNGSNQGWPSYLVVENNANKVKYKSSLQSGMLAICLAMPQASVKLETTTVVSALKHSTMDEAVKMASWANAATTPTLSELVFDWSEFSRASRNESATAIIPMSDNIELDFLDNESDFMHLMATSEFPVNIVVESIEEGKPDFYESDTIDFIDEPFFI
jgi:hypothetical protein